MPENFAFGSDSFDPDQIVEGVVVENDLEVKGSTHVQDLTVHGSLTATDISVDASDIDHNDLQNVGTLTHSQLEAEITAIENDIDGILQDVQDNATATITLSGAVSALSTTTASNTANISTLSTTTAANTSAISTIDAGLIGGATLKKTVRVATTTALGTLSGLLTVDGVTLVAGDRVLVKNEVLGGRVNNGIWTAASGSWTRATDANSSADFVGKMWVIVNQGSTQAGTVWQLDNTSVNLGSDNITFTQILPYTATSPLTKNGVALGLNQTLINHTNLQNVGTNTHAQIDTFISTTVPNALAGKIDKSDVYLIGDNGSITAYPAASDTDAARGTALASAVAAASSGQIIYCGPGVFDLQTTPITITAGKALVGTGHATTIIKSAYSGAQAALQMEGEGVVLRSFTFFPSKDDGTYQNPVGSRNTTTPFTNAYLEDVHIVGASSDAFYVGTPTANGMTATLVNCRFECLFDAFADLSKTSTDNYYKFINCDFVSYPLWNGSNPVRNIGVLLWGASADFYNCRWSVLGHENSTHACGLQLGGFTFDWLGNVRLYDCSFDVSAPTGLVADSSVTREGSSTGNVQIFGGTGSGTNGEIVISDTGVGSGETTLGVANYTIDHADLENIGTNSHDDIDTFIANTISTISVIESDIDTNVSAISVIEGDYEALSATMTASFSLFGGLLAAASKRQIQWTVFIPTTDITTGDGKLYYHVGPTFDGKNIVYAHARCVEAGSSGTTDIQITRIRSGSPVDMFSTKLTIDSGETGSDTADSAVVINTSNDDLDTNDILRVDIDAVSTGAKGLLITLETN